MSYQLVKGIIKVINPNSKPVIGIGDGVGKFTWIPTDKMLDYFPKPYNQWQTTFFKMPIDFDPKWRPEKNFEQYAYTYTQNTIAAPANTPTDFLTVQQQQTLPPNPQYSPTGTIPENPFEEFHPSPPTQNIGIGFTAKEPLGEGIDKLISLIETQNSILQNILVKITGNVSNIENPINPLPEGSQHTILDNKGVPKLEF